jgi:hypothetical protein
VDEKLKNKLESFSPKEHEAERKLFYLKLEQKGIKQEIYEIINIAHGLFLSPERKKEALDKKEESDTYWDHRETIEKLLGKVVDTQRHWKKKILPPFNLPTENQFEPSPDGTPRRPLSFAHRPKNLGEEYLIEQGMKILLDSGIRLEEAYNLLHEIFRYFFNIEKDSSAIKTKYHTLCKKSPTKNL